MSRPIALQDLAFYSNGSVFGKSSVALVTSTYEVVPTWLVYSLLSLVLGKKKAKGPDNIVLISFLDRSQFYHRALLKAGIDLNRKKAPVCGSAPYTYIDLSKILTEDLAVLESTIKNSIKSMPESTCIIFESLDMLLPLGRSSNEVLNFSSNLQKLASNVFFFCQADEELLNDSADHNNLRVAQNACLLGLLYKSKLSLAVRPLSTGRANDVTGTLTISKGPLCTDDSVIEDSYQYLVTNDTVKLFYR